MLFRQARPVLGGRTTSHCSHKPSHGHHMLALQNNISRPILELDQHTHSGSFPGPLLPSSLPTEGRQNPERQKGGPKGVLLDKGRTYCDFFCNRSLSVPVCLHVSLKAPNIAYRMEYITPLRLHYPQCHTSNPKSRVHLVLRFPTTSAMK